jgi:hypothetical protein
VPLPVYVVGAAVGLAHPQLPPVAVVYFGMY